MRVLVSVDMEGVAGVVSPTDVSPGNPEYERNRALMTDEASAAVRGLLADTPDASIVVVDAHAAFRNVLPERLDRRATLLRGDPRPLSMLTGIDEGADAVCLIGYHGRAGTPRSVLAHTVSGGTVAAVRCNGVELGELGLNAALAGHFGAVTLLVTGDDTVAREAVTAAPGSASVVVKWARGTRAAENLHPAVACERIEAAARAALARCADLTPWTIEGPVDLEIDLLRPHMAERACAIPGVERRAPLTLGFRAADLPAAYGLIDVITVLAAAP